MLYVNPYILNVLISILYYYLLLIKNGLKSFLWNLYVSGYNIKAYPSPNLPILPIRYSLLLSEIGTLIIFI